MLKRRTCLAVTADTFLHSTLHTDDQAVSARIFLVSQIVCRLSLDYIVDELYRGWHSCPRGYTPYCCAHLLSTSEPYWCQTVSLDPAFAQ